MSVSLFFFHCRNCWVINQWGQQKTITNPNRYGRNEGGWHFCLCRRVRQVSVEVIIRISSQLWERGTHWVYAESRWQKGALVIWSSEHVSLRTRKKSVNGNRHLTGLHATGVKPYVIEFLVPGNWKSRHWLCNIWACKMGRILLIVVNRPRYHCISPVTPGLGKLMKWVGYPE